MENPEKFFRESKQTITLSYLPGDLIHFFECPAPWFRDPIRNDQHLEVIRDLISSGYYRAAHYMLREISPTPCHDENRLMAESLCSMSPFNLRLAYHLMFRFRLPSGQVTQIFCRCLEARSLSAARFAMGTTSCISNVDLLPYCTKGGFSPGFVEALFLEPSIIHECGLTPCVTLTTYPSLETSDAPVRYYAVHAIRALKAGNYRLARYIKARHPKINEEYIIRDFLSDFSASSKTLNLLLKEGWITPRRAEETVSWYKSLST